MQAESPLTDAAILDAKASLPSHVVYRVFVKETVILNLQAGRYHGLNPTAGRMLETLERTATVREAAQTLAHEYQQDSAEIEADLCVFCRDLVSRGLVLLDAVPAGAGG